VSGDVPHRQPFHKVEPTHGDRITTCVPLVPLQAAAGGFGDLGGDLMADSEWVQIRSKYALKEGMFVARVVGKSMEPRIADGAYCLFQGPVVGSREGKVVLVRLRDEVDPDTGERFTLKQYTSEKEESDDGTWSHKTITLRPINSHFQPIVLRGDDAEDRCDVVAELIEVLK
jgi:SOS-response transcriptional repressor LexA